MSELPEGWATVLLDELVEFNPKHPSDIDKTQAVSFVPMPAVSADTGIIETPATRPLAEVWKGFTHFAENDVIFAKITPCMENGKIAVARGLTNGLACGSTEFHVLRSWGGVLPEFIWRYLRQLSFRTEAEGAMTGAVGQRRVPADYLRSQLVPLPPIAEQQRIVAKLDALTARTARARADLERVPALAEQHRRAILGAALSGALTQEWREANTVSWSYAEIEALRTARDRASSSRRGSRLRPVPPLLSPGQNDLPSTWASGCLADVAELVVGYAFKSEWFDDKGPLLLRGANVAVGNVCWENAKRLRADLASEFSDYVLKAGDIVIAMDRPLISSGLKIAELRVEDDGALLVQRVASPRPSSLISKRYLWWVLNSELFTDEIKKHATGSDLPHISGNDILATSMPLPPLKEQEAIARRLDSAFAEIDRLVAEAAAARRLLDHLDQQILAKAFRGELVPQDPADVPASVLLERIRAERAATPTKARRGRKPQTA